MIEANEALSLQSIRPEDVRIDVEMGDIGTADFERVGEAIPLGEIAARKLATALAVRRSRRPVHRLAKRVPQRNKGDVRVAGVQFEGLKRVTPEYLAQRSQIQMAMSWTSPRSARRP